MKKLIVVVLVVAGLWYLADLNTDEVGKQQYTFDLICARVTGSEAMRKEANRMDKILTDNGVIMNESEVISARNHWVRVYDVNSYQELIQNSEFLINCKYNACIYEGFETKACIQKKVDSCLGNDISYNNCFPK